jgi:hypothetical protein
MRIPLTAMLSVVADAERIVAPRGERDEMSRTVKIW